MEHRESKGILSLGRYMTSPRTLIVVFAIIILFSSNIFASSFHEAAREGNVERLKQLAKVDNVNLDQPDSNGLTPLLFAAAFGHFEAVKFLIEKGATVDSKSATGIIPLYDACVGGFLHIVKFLIANGASVNNVSKEGVSVLYGATMGGDFVKHLRYRLKVEFEINNGKVQTGYSIDYVAREIDSLLTSSSIGWQAYAVLGAIIFICLACLLHIITLIISAVK